MKAENLTVVPFHRSVPVDISAVSCVTISSEASEVSNAWAIKFLVIEGSFLSFPIQVAQSHPTRAYNKPLPLFRVWWLQKKNSAIFPNIPARASIQETKDSLPRPTSMNRREWLIISARNRNLTSLVLLWLSENIMIHSGYRYSIILRFLPILVCSDARTGPAGYLVSSFSTSFWQILRLCHTTGTTRYKALVPQIL